MNKELFGSKRLDVINGNKCDAIGGCNNPASEPHSCPFASEINDNDEPEYCTCCDDCQHECAMDI